MLTFPSLFLVTAAILLCGKLTGKIMTHTSIYIAYIAFTYVFLHQTVQLPRMLSATSKLMQTALTSLSTGTLRMATTPPAMSATFTYTSGRELVPTLGIIAILAQYLTQTAI